MGALSALYLIGRHLDWSFHLTDLDHQLCAARVLASGGDPYAAVGEGRACQWGFPLYYPATALVALMPIAWMPPVAARAVFVFVGGFALCFALTKDGWHRMPLFLSGAYYVAVSRAQWSPILSVAVVLPWLAVLLAVKPTLGAAVAAGMPRKGWWCAIGGGVGLLLVSFALRPTWLFEWLAVVRHAPAALLAVACGPLAWVAYGALLKWRNPAARITAAVASVPLTQTPYEAVPLFYAPRTVTESALLALATHVGGLLSTNAGPFPDTVATMTYYGRWCTPIALAVAVWCVVSKPRTAPAWVTVLLVGLNVTLMAVAVYLSFLFSGDSRPAL